MLRRKKSSSGRTGRRRRGESNSSARDGDEVQPPPEFSEYDYEKLSPFLLKSLRGTNYPFLSTGYIHLVHELENMFATNNFTLGYMAGEIQFMNEGYYPTPKLSERMMPSFDTQEHGAQSSDDESKKAPSVKASAVPIEEEADAKICLLPEEGEDDDFDEYPAFHVGTRFWTWCRKNFMGKIDTDFLEDFKKHILDEYGEERLNQFLVNEPWKYRKRAASRRKSLNNSHSKKKVSISNDLTTPSTSNGVKNGARKGSLSGYRIPNRRTSDREKDLANNNKIMPIIDSMVHSACKEFKDGRSAPETPARRGRSRMTSPEFTRERKIAKMEIDSDSDEIEMPNGRSQAGPSSRLQSPRQLKQEKIEAEDDEYERMGNGTSHKNGMNGHSKGPRSPKRKNGDIRNYFSSVPKNSAPSTNGARDNGENGYGDFDPSSDIEDFDKRAIGSKIVAKLIAGGILQESSAQIFDQMSREDGEEGPSTVSLPVEMSEEGKDDAEDQEVGELAEELHSLQMNLKEEMNTEKALMMLTWRRAKAHFAFFHTFDELKRGDYDLFKIGINMYRDFPNRKLPGISESMLLKVGIKKRNRLARLHYGKIYRRHPKFRWHRAYVPTSNRLS